MDPKITPDSIIEWESGKEVLTVAYECEYLADTWPKRLGFDDLAVLQAEGNSTHFKAWKTCLLHAVNAGEIPIQDEQWFLGAIEPSEYWIGHKPKMALIPSCQKYQGDNVAFFSSELVTKYTVGPKDFAEYLKKYDEKPSKYIAAWFDACGIHTATEPEPDKTKKGKSKPIHERRLDALKDWLESLGYKLEDEVIILPKHYTLKTVYTELCKRNSDLFLTIELNSFDSHFWGKQKIVELTRGNKSAIL
ncbi:hypothetical protein [Methylobacter sp.]|uniref:hypothetical protein n=1 Tax=Methylobacter sp. TaxID=2051955 RepID=UPI003DA48AB3